MNGSQRIGSRLFAIVMAGLVLASGAVLEGCAGSSASADSSTSAATQATTAAATTTAAPSSPTVAPADLKLLKMAPDNGTAGTNFANAMTSISANNADNQANALLAGGNARMSGYTGIANALSSGFANYRPQQQQGYAVPAGYQMGSGYLGNAMATGQGYQPLDYATANAGYYD